MDDAPSDELLALAALALAALSLLEEDAAALDEGDTNTVVVVSPVVVMDVNTSVSVLVGAGNGGRTNVVVMPSLTERVVLPSWA